VSGVVCCLVEFEFVEYFTRVRTEEDRACCKREGEEDRLFREIERKKKKKKKARHTTTEQVKCPV